MRLTILDGFGHDLRALLKHAVAVLVLVTTDLIVELIAGGPRSDRPHLIRMAEAVEAAMYWSVVPALVIFGLECILLLLLNACDVVTCRLFEVRQRYTEKKALLAKADSAHTQAQ